MEIGRKSRREIPEGQNLNVSRETANGYTPYSKMTENTLFFCLHVNWPLLPRFKPDIPLNSAGGIEATRPIKGESHSRNGVFFEIANKKITLR